MSKKYDVDFKKFDLEAYAAKFAQRDSNKSRDGDAWFNCCFHEENTASLHITNKQLFYCQGCSAGGGVLDFVRDVNKTTTAKAFEIIAAESGQENVMTTFDKAPPKEMVYAPNNVVATYMYNKGHVVKYRLENKQFTWAHYNNGKWYYGVGDFEVGMYSPLGLDGDVVLVEGEKDVDALCALGVKATSSPNGAKAWKQEYTEELKQASRVLIMNDNDETGMMHAMEVNKFLILDGITCKRLIPQELNDNDIKGYDVYDAIQDIGSDKVTQIINNAFASSGRWDARIYRDHEILTNVPDEEPVEIKEEVEVEVITPSGMGEEYDKFIRDIVEDVKKLGMISEINELAIKEKAKEIGIGITSIKNRIKFEVENSKRGAMVGVESQVMHIPDVGTDVDIVGSGYNIMEDSGAIYDDNGNEIMGHFLSFFGIVVDAEKEQDNDVKVMLVYNTPQNLNKISHVVLPKRQLSTSTDIISILSGYNINVTQANGLQVVKYLQDLQNHFNERTVIMKSLSRFGWYQDKLMPYEQDTSKLVFESHTTGRVVDKLLDKKGDKEKSRALLQEMSQYSENIASIIGAAVGSLVLSYMDDGGGQSFAINVWGGTSTGKSVACQGVASMFGYPYKDGGWWGAGNGTLNADINHNSLLSNLPNFVDDPALNRGMDSYTKKDFIYAATSGQGRARMQRDGKTQQDLSDWCNIMIMTNETIFIDDSISDGGAKARCIELKFDKVLDQSTAERWIDEMGKHYGHFAIDIAKKIRSYSKESLDNVFKKFIRWFLSKGVDGKRAVNASYIMLGLSIAEQAIGIESIKGTDEWIVKQIRGSGMLSDGERGYFKLMDIIETSINTYRSVYDRDGRMVAALGESAYGDRVVNIPMMTLTKYAKDHNFNRDAVIAWGMSNDRIVESMNENDMAKPIFINNGVEQIGVVQVKYPWLGNSTNNEYHGGEFKVGRLGE